MAPSENDDEIDSCVSAREALMQFEVAPQTSHLPYGPTPYFPRTKVIEALGSFSVRKIICCSCSPCRRHACVSAGADDRWIRCEERELLGEYATMFGLLVYLRHPGLILLFCQRQISLYKSYLNEGDLAFLDKCNGLTAQGARILRQEILSYQFRFRVRSFAARTAISVLDKRETLPIEEDAVAVGEGDFGEVFAFSVPDEYVDESLVPYKIKRFARKIFDLRISKTHAAKEWINHLYANRLQHPNLMPALAAYEHDPYFFILFELADSTLYRFLNSDGSLFTSEELWKQVNGLASGLAYLHGVPVEGEQWSEGEMYHLDLKPANILIVNQVMKIADFGLSRYKPWPTMSNSKAEGESRPPGIGIYAPPGCSGQAYDAYSLGAILSEIACFDLGGASRLAQYRRKRVDDVLEDNELKSRHFFYDKGHEMKQSVSTEHADLLGTVNESRESSIRGGQRWNKHFFKPELFVLIEELLHKQEGSRPTVAHVANSLKQLANGASVACQRDSGYVSQPLLKLDIWEKTLDGSVAKERAEPVNTFTAHYEDKPCGLYLFPDTETGSITIRRYVYDFEQALPELKSESDTIYRERGPYTRIQPSYLREIADLGLRLLHERHKLSCDYNFCTLSDVLRFQSVITGEYVHESANLELTSFTKFKERIFMSPKEVRIAKPAQLQLWTDKDIASDKNSSFGIKIAIMTAEELNVIEITESFKSDQKLTIGVTPPQSVVQIPGAEIYTVDITNGISLQREQPGKRKRFDGFWLECKNEQDCEKFRDSLIRLQAEKVRRVPTISFHSGVTRWAPAGV